MVNDSVAESLPVDIGQQQHPRKLSRRGFFKLMGVAGAAAGASMMGIKLAKIDALEEKASQLSLLAKVNARKFDSDNLPHINTIEDLKRGIATKTEALKGVSAAGIYISDIDQNAQVAIGNFTEEYIPGSLIKIPLMYQIWLRGKTDGVEYITEEIAGKILGKSESSRDFIMQLPFYRDKKPEEFNMVIAEMLRNSQIPSKQASDGNIQINLIDYFNFLRKTELPQIIKNAMKQTEEDDNTNYGVSKVLRENSKDMDAYFKIGLAQNDNETINSYVFMLGENIKAVGYVRGSNLENVHEQMLITAASLAKYSSR